MPFDPIRSYDKPDVLMGQILDGRISFSSLRQTLFEPSALSPEERRGVVARVKEQVGRNPVTDALVDVALNPFVWLMFLTGPEGPGAVKAAGRIFTGGKEYGAWVAQKMGLLRTLHLLSPMDELAGTPMQSLALHTAAGVRAMKDQVSLIVGPAEDRLLTSLSKRLGVPLDSLDVEKAPTREARELLTKLKYLMEVDGAGWAKEAPGIRRASLNPERGFIDVRRTGGGTWTRTEIPMDEWERLSEQAEKVGKVWRGTRGDGTEYILRDYAKVGPQGVDVSFGRGKGRGALVDAGRVDAMVQDLGAREYLDSLREFSRARMVDMFGDDAVWAAGRRFVADPDKLLKHARAMKRSGGAGDFMVDILSPDVVRGLEDGTITEERLGSVLKEAFEGVVDPERYVPRNILRRVGADGKVQKGMFTRAEIGRANTFASARARSRTVEKPIYDPDELQEIHDLFGGTEELQKEMARSRKVVRETLDRGEVPAVHSVGGVEKWRRYANETAGKWATTIQPLGDEVRLAFEDFPPPVGAKTFPLAMVRGKRVELTDRWWDLPDEMQPLGGWNADDLMGGVLRNMGDQKAAVRFQNQVLPVIMGQRPVHEGVLDVVNQWQKDVASWFVGSHLGKMIETGGGAGARMLDRLRQFSESSDLVGETRQLGGLLTKMLYSSHLGANMGSVTTNLMQPLSSTLTIVAPEALAKGYVRAFGQMAKYAEARMKYGPRITEQVRGQLLKEAFSYEHVLDDGTKVTVDLAEMADLYKSPNEHLGLPTLGTWTTRPSKTLNWTLLELPLKPFEKAEWLNRLSAANASMELFKGAGRMGTMDDFIRARSESAQLVQRTQFGSDFLYRPRLFNEGVLANPLVRMFLQFPVRQFTAIAHTPGIIGRGTRTFAGVAEIPAVLGDAFRTAGHAAIAYEVGKNLLGADMSRALMFGNLESLTGGGATFNDPSSLIPTPPAFDLLVNAAKAIGSGDARLWSETMMKMVPMGVAFQRALGSAGDLQDVPVLGNLQKQWVDWSTRAPDGSVPVFKADGSLSGWRQPSEVVLRGLGADLGRWGREGEVNQFLVKNRDQITEARRGWTTAMLANDSAKATQIKAAFEKKFGLPLTVREDQLEAARRGRETPVGEKIVQSLPRDMQDLYRGAAFTGAGRPSGGATLEEAKGQAPDSEKRYIWSGPAGGR